MEQAATRPLRAKFGSTLNCTRSAPSLFAISFIRAATHRQVKTISRTLSFKSSFTLGFALEAVFLPSNSHAFSRPRSTAPLLLKAALSLPASDAGPAFATAILRRSRHWARILWGSQRARGPRGLERLAISIFWRRQRPACPGALAAHWARALPVVSRFLTCRACKLGKRLGQAAPFFCIKKR